MIKNKAFTLIELLVVVLIIGILAAVALPQYRKAVDRARLQEALIQGRALLEAQQLYLTTNGNITTDLDNLDITMPVSSWTCSGGTCSSSTTSGASFEVSNYYGNNHLTLFCRAHNEYAQQLCVSLGGKDSRSVSTTTYYIMHKK